MSDLKKSLRAAFQSVSNLVTLGTFWLLRQPRPRFQGKLTLRGLSDPVEVLRDKWGVPHIYARSTHDLLFAQGFVHAQERLWQMDFNRRVVAGRLSEILGPVSLPLDRWIRTLTMRRVAEGEVELLDNETRSFLEAYADGVNACIKHEPLPLECRLLGYTPEPWIVADSLAWAKMMAWDLSVNWEAEILRARLIAKLGPEVAASLEPDIPPDWARVIPPGVDYTHISEESLGRAEQAREYTGPGASEGIGSNNWVLSGSRTTTGMPILANDMHLGMTAPSIWYENHISGGDLHVAGVSFPGIPAVMAGHNEHLAWGFTNGFPDVQDLYMEHLRQTPDGSTEYEFQGEWLKAEVKREEIKVKDAEPAFEDVIVTRHGPIINSLVEEKGLDTPLALRWTALEKTNTIKTLFDMNRATSCQDFHEALRGWICPTQNTVYADRQGNIAYTFPGNIPMRAKGDGSVPVPGWTGEYEWTGYIPYDELPHMFNPKPGYIASANNRVVDDGYPHWVCADFCSSSRATRIVEIIEAQEKLGIEDIKRMHMDQISVLAREIMRPLEDFVPDDPALAPIFELFHNWDGHLAVDDPRSAIYEVFVQRLTRILTAQRLGDLSVWYAGQGPTPILSEVSIFAEHAREWLLATLSDPDSPWWDSNNGNGRREYITQAMRETLEILKDTCGPNLEDWAWGKVHTLTFGHPLGSVKTLKGIFNRGPYPIGGDMDTVWASGASRVDLSERPVIGPPARFIADLSDWNNSLGILVPGQSGHPASRHYDDNIEGWFKGEYHPMPFDRDRVIASTLHRLTLEP
jgi:penicillin amidase